MVLKASDSTGRRILEVAQRMFFEQGLAVSTLDIATEAGISKTTLYQAFPTKDALLGAVLDQILGFWVKKIASGKDKTGDFREAIEKGVLEISEFTRQISPGFAFSLKKYHPEVFRQFIAKRDRAMHQIFEVAYGKALKSGLLRESVGKDFLFHFLLHSLDFLHEKTSGPSSPMRVEAVLTGMLDLMLNGILKTPGGSRPARGMGGSGQAKKQKNAAKNFRK